MLEIEDHGRSSLVKVYASAVNGITATTIIVEGQMSPGTRFTLVGMPDIAVKESHDRIMAALTETGINYQVRRYIFNLAPANIRKEGSAYDLPIAVALVALMEQIDMVPHARTMIMGELSLDGHVQPIRGILPIAINARREGFDTLIVPRANAHEASVVDGLKVLGADTLQDVLSYLRGAEDSIEGYNPHSSQHESLLPEGMPDFSEVKGQEEVKRAMEIAAAGNHNIIMVGPPGSGKSMIAKRIPSILPPFTMEEALETTMIHSVAGTLPSNSGLMTVRPFRSPHHSTSNVALVGGGTVPKPGEISLAHNGVLFLDELPEFPRSVLEVLRQPLEDRNITVSRARMTVNFPASFMLVASMNPCPCGHYNNPQKECSCMQHQVANYLSRISGPLLDRIDIQVEIIPVPFEALSSRQPAESSVAIRERVIRARQIQQERFKDIPGVYTNAQMTPSTQKDFLHTDEKGLRQLKVAMDKFALSARAYDRILKVARTIADLEASDTIRWEHIAEAVGYRKLDRDNWGKKSI